MKKAALPVIAALVAAVALALAPGAGAAPPPSQGCNVVYVEAQPITVTVAGQVYVYTPGTSGTVELTGLVGAILCPLLSGGGVTTP